MFFIYICFKENEVQRFQILYLSKQFRFKALSNMLISNQFSKLGYKNQFEKRTEQWPC